MRKRRLEKYEEEEYNPFESKTFYGIPMSFILITIIMVCFFILILLFMGPCTDSGLVYNGKMA